MFTLPCFEARRTNLDFDSDWSLEACQTHRSEFKQCVFETYRVYPRGHDRACAANLKGGIDGKQLAKACLALPHELTNIHRPDGAGESAVALRQLAQQRPRVQRGPLNLPEVPTHQQVLACHGHAELTSPDHIGQKGP
ncbi:MAG: hypothetical protein IH968_17980 [Gemmatimonadetes bacterium]|nr:hypothetical protein [Gemmatimonadota bacterium]